MQCQAVQSPRIIGETVSLTAFGKFLLWDIPGLCAVATDCSCLTESSIMIFKYIYLTLELCAFDTLHSVCQASLRASY